MAGALLRWAHSSGSGNVAVRVDDVDPNVSACGTLDVHSRRGSLMRAIAWASLLALGCGKHRGPSAQVSVHTSPCLERVLSAEITSNTHMLGWGSGLDATTADDAARAEIAKVFSVTVRQAFESDERARVEMDDEGTRMSRSTTQRSITQSTTDTTLKGVEIARHWMDNSHHCALAVLNRDQAAERLLVQIRRTEQAISEHVSVAEGDSDPFTVLRHLNTAIDRATERDELNQTLLVMDRQHTGSSVLATGSLQSQRRSALTEAGVRLSTAKLPESLSSSINSGLHNNGLAINPNGTIGVHAAVSTTQNGPDDYGFHHVAARLTVRFYAHAGTSISEFQIDGRGSSQQRSRAKTAAIEQLVQKFNADDTPFEVHVRSLLQQRIEP